MYQLLKLLLGLRTGLRLRAAGRERATGRKNSQERNCRH